MKMMILIDVVSDLRYSVATGRSLDTCSCDETKFFVAFLKRAIVTVKDQERAIVEDVQTLKACLLN